MSGNRVARGLAGILAGLLTGIVELVFLLLAGVTPVARPGVGRVADRLVALERARLAAWFGHDTGEAAPVRNRYGYLALRAVVGVVGGYVAAAAFSSGSCSCSAARGRCSRGSPTRCGWCCPASGW
ncbi:hypothetical protein ACFQX6_45070 [Streptosporangium lutulentum]